MNTGRLFKCFCLLAALWGFSFTISAQPNLSGTWDNGSGITFIQPQQLGNSICVVACDEIEVPVLDENAAPTVISGPSRPSYRQEFHQKVADLNTRQVEEDPVLRCTPPGVPRIGSPDKIIQTQEEIVFLYDDVSGNFFRVIPLDGRGHRDDVERSFLGDAIGWWEGDTLVVETNQFTDQTWLTDDGSFHTEDLIVEERLQLEGEELVWQAVAYDPSILTEPWQLPNRRSARSQSEIHQAALCQERDLEHIVDGTHHDNPR